MEFNNLREQIVENKNSSTVNLVTSPADLHRLFEHALNSGDLDALVALYAFDAVLMAGSGMAEGINAIRQVLADYVAMEPHIEVTTRRVVEAGDTALLVADWRFRGTARDGGVVSTSGTSIEVARRQPDGSWRYHIDLPYGLGE